MENFDNNNFALQVARYAFINDIMKYHDDTNESETVYFVQFEDFVLFAVQDGSGYTHYYVQQNNNEKIQLGSCEVA